MRMNAIVKFDRPIDPERHYISPGSYAFKANGKSYQFDFMDSTCHVNTINPSILEINVKNADYESFPDTKEFLKNLDKITEIEEFFIFTGEDDEPEIHPVKLISCSIEDDDKHVYELSDEIVKSANVTSN